MKPNGAAIRAIRQAQGRSLRQLEAATGLRRGYISRLETGERGASTETVRLIASCLGVPIEAISYPDQPIVQASPETIRQITELLSTSIARAAS